MKTGIDNQHVRMLLAGVPLVLATAACENITFDDVSERVSESAVAADVGGEQVKAAASRDGSLLDIKLRKLLKLAGVDPVDAPPPQDPALVELGRNLFFERELAGRRNIACSTCHSPFLGSADAQSQSRGQGTIGLGAARRQDGDEFFEFLPRNAIGLWNRGVDGFDTLFWDGRLGGTPEEGFFSPAGDQTPQNFTNALSLFSILPITPRQEMRGFEDQTEDIFGAPNELALIDDEDFTGIFSGATQRILAVPGYDELLAAAFPGIPESQIDIVNLGEAMGAFMTEAFTALNTPFDRYLAGDDSAMSDSAKRGALLFYGRANCANCHSGNLFTDLDFHNIAAPQVGTGNFLPSPTAATPEAPLDFGRGRITGLVEDNFRFRTPPLRNIELTGPWFHNGAYANLEDAVRHHLDPAGSLATYDDTQVEPELVGTFVDDPEVIDTLLSTLDPLLGVGEGPLADHEIASIMDFLSALTDPASLNQFDLIPDSLPSGLPLND